MNKNYKKIIKRYAKTHGMVFIDNNDYFGFGIVRSLRDQLKIRSVKKFLHGVFTPILITEYIEIPQWTTAIHNIKLKNNDRFRYKKYFELIKGQELQFVSDGTRFKIPSTYEATCIELDMFANG